MSTSISQKLAAQDVIVRHMIWLPGAGIEIAAYPPAWVAFCAFMEGSTSQPIFKDLPILEQFGLEEDVDEDLVANALEGTDGFLVCLETPKRKFFSDGSPRMNWADTWHEWRHVRSVDEIEGLALAYVKDTIERDRLPDVISKADDED